MNKLYIIETSEDFDNSLQNIIENWSYLFPHSITNFYKELMQKIELLQIFPRMYPILKYRTEVRKMKVKNYIVFYEIEGNIIYIMDIIHQSSKLFNNQD